MGEERRRTETSRAGPYSCTIQGKVPHQAARFSCIFLGLFLLREMDLPSYQSLILLNVQIIKLKYSLSDAMFLTTQNP